MLDWDVTAYEDSQGHKCFQCRNCQKQIEKNQQDQHFTWNLDNSPNYKCQKSEDGDEKVCHMCDNIEVHKKGMYKCWVSDFGGSVFIYLLIS